MRRIESLPEEQVYQVLDYIEFLDTKYGGVPGEASGLQRFAEGIQDKMRQNAMNPSTLREAFQLISTADKVLSSVSKAGRQLMEELTGTGELSEEDEEAGADGDGDEEVGTPAGAESKPDSSDEDGGADRVDPPRRPG